MKEYNMLMAALVGIVAIAGLVVFFTSGPTGAYNANIYNVATSTPASDYRPIGQEPAVYNTGLRYGKECSTQPEGAEECCNNKCWRVCEGRGRTIGYRLAADCQDTCMSACDQGSERALLQY